MRRRVRSVRHSWSGQSGLHLVARLHICAGADLCLQSSLLIVTGMKFRDWNSASSPQRAGRTLTCAAHCERDSDPANGDFAGIVTVQQLRDMAAAEASIAPPTLAFLQAALPAVPALVLGFVFLEGRSLVRRPNQDPDPDPDHRSRLCNPGPGLTSSHVQKIELSHYVVLLRPTADAARRESTPWTES